MKATKNHAEIVGSRAAHKRDGAAVVRFLAWLDKEAPSGNLTEIDAVAGARELPPRYRRAQGYLLPDHRRRGAERRDRALSRHPRLQPHHREERALPDRLRRPIRGRHHRYHPHHHRRRAERGNARPFHPRAQGAYCHRHRDLSGKHQRRAARSAGAYRAVAGRARFRPRHRPRRRQLFVGTRRPGPHFKAGYGCASPRHDPVERARLLQNRRLRHPHRKPGAGDRGAGAGRRRKAAQCFRDPDLGADRPTADRHRAC